MPNPAEGYEGYMVPTLFAPWAARLVEAANPVSGERVLDVGCGTGIVARQVASRIEANGTVTGIDPNPNMLAVARTAAARDGVAIEWLEGSAEKLPFPAGSFDVVLSQFALMFFTDKTAALAEMRRVARTTGRVFLSVWQGMDRHPFYEILHHAFQQRVGISALDDIFALGNTDNLRSLLLRAGFERVEIQLISMTAEFPDPERFLAGEIEVDAAAIPALQHLDTAARQRIVAALAADMRLPLKAVTRGDHVVMPFHACIAGAWR